ncbi:cobalamin-binding protein [Hydrogenovibrio halophilus]|uniref:cobalamin-binding protein n=1 Tax=Hydrogenovibrio halophilus TaxID=373391 RepID=UPI00037FB3B6|nr:cobalamin-binding protein [Hydrogenovibrio halophilus]
MPGFKHNRGWTINPARFVQPDQSPKTGFLPGLVKSALLTLGIALITPVWAGADRIITLAPHLTELVYSAGAGEALVATVAHSDHPMEARTLPRVGNYQGIQVEAILAQRPDLILAWRSGNQPQLVQRLKQLGLKVVTTEPETLTDIPKQIEHIGRLAGTQAIAERSADQLRQTLVRLFRQYRTDQLTTVFYQLWHAPMMTLNGKHFISQGIRLCGGRNVFAGLAPLVPEISHEAVLKADPDVILLGGGPTISAEWKQDWQEYGTLKAVRNDRLHSVSADVFQRPTARFIEHLPQLCETIQNGQKKYSM